MTISRNILSDFINNDEGFLYCIIGAELACGAYGQNWNRDDCLFSVCFLHRLTLSRIPLCVVHDVDGSKEARASDTGSLRWRKGIH